MLLPDTPLADAELVAERIAATLLARVATASGEPVCITFGVAERVEHQTGAPAAGDRRRGAAGREVRAASLILFPPHSYTHRPLATTRTSTY